MVHRSMPTEWLDATWVKGNNYTLIKLGSPHPALIVEWRFQVMRRCPSTLVNFRSSDRNRIERSDLHTKLGFDVVYDDGYVLREISQFI